MSSIDFPATVDDVAAAAPGNKTSTAPRIGAWEVTVMDVYKSFNDRYGKDGLWVDIKTSKNDKVRNVFYPDPPSSKTLKFIEQLESLGIAASMIGGWENLRGYVLMWTNEDREFDLKENGTTRHVKYQLEYPISVVRAPARAAVTDAAVEEVDSYTQFKNLAVGKTKNELKFALTKTPDLSAEFGEGVASGILINDLISDGVFVMENGKIQKGPNF